MLVPYDKYMDNNYVDISHTKSLVDVYPKKHYNSRITPKNLVMNNLAHYSKSK